MAESKWRAAGELASIKSDFEINQKDTILLNQLLDSIPDLIFYKDRKLVYQGGNEQFLRFTGIRNAAFVGKTDFDLFNAEVADRFTAQDISILEEKKIYRNEVWESYPDGTRVLFDTLKAPLYGAAGDIIGILGISRDITDKKKAEEALLYQSKLQDVLLNVSYSLINPKIDGINDIIDRSLCRFAEVMSADSAFILCYNNDNNSLFTSNEWHERKTTIKQY